MIQLGERFLASFGRPIEAAGHVAQWKGSKAAEDGVDAAGIVFIDIRPFLGGFAFSLHRGRQERPVPPKGPVPGDPRLPAHKAWPQAWRHLRPASVEHRILGEERHVAVHRVRAGARDDVDEPAGRAPEFCAGDCAGHAELLHHLKTDGDAVAARGLVAVVQAIHLDTVVPPAQSLERKAAVGGRLADDRHRPLYAALRRAGKPGGERDKVQVVARAGRSFLNPFSAQRHAGRGRGRLHRLLLLVDFHLCGRPAEGQHEILLNRRAHADLHAGQLGGVEARPLRRQPVDAHGEPGNAVTAFLIGLGAARIARLHMLHNNGHARHRRAARVAHHAVDRPVHSRRLRGQPACGTRGQHGHRESPHPGQ